MGTCIRPSPWIISRKIFICNTNAGISFHISRLEFFRVDEHNSIISPGLRPL